MSTAGKVLVVLVMLIGHRLPDPGRRGRTAQFQRQPEAPAAGHRAGEDPGGPRADPARTSPAFATRRPIAQEKIDREIAALRSQQTDLERTRTQIIDTLIAAAIRARHGEFHHRRRQGHRSSTATTEFDAEEKALDDLRRQVQALRSNNTQLMDRLQSLRDQFQATHQKNVGMLGKGR